MKLMGERQLLHDLITRPGQTLDGLYDAVRQIPGSIDQHLPALRYLAQDVESVLEFGAGMSTVAWLAGGATVTSVDVEPMPWMEPLNRLASGEAGVPPLGGLQRTGGPPKGGTPARLTFVHQSSLTFPPQPADLLFVDTLHTYAQLAAELQRHGPLAKRWIVLHDTESFGWPDSPLTAKYHPGDPGLQAALGEWLSANQQWRRHKIYTHQHGLIVLRK